MTLNIYAYSGHDVFGHPPNWIAEPEAGFHHPAQMIQYTGFGMPFYEYGDTRQDLRFRYLFEDRQEISEMIAFFDENFGMFGHIWVPSWRADIEVTAAIGAADTQLTIEDIGYAAHWLPNDVTGRYLCLVFPDETQVCRKVTGAPAADTLQLESAIGKACAAADLEYFLCCFLYFVRFDQDEMELEYHGQATAEVDLAFREVPDEL